MIGVWPTQPYVRRRDIFQSWLLTSSSAKNLADRKRGYRSLPFQCDQAEQCPAQFQYQTPGHGHSTIAEVKGPMTKSRGDSSVIAPIKPIQSALFRPDIIPIH
jgi:hypothetical protein